MYSLIDNPDESLRTIERFVESVRSPSVRTVHLDQSRCRQIDYDAEALSGAIAQLARAREREHSFLLRGTSPRDPEAAAVVLATGVPWIIGVDDLPEQPEFRRFELVRGQGGNERARSSSTRERTTQDLVLYIDQCLNDYKFGLTMKGRKYLSRIVGEVIGNAEDHGGTSHWWAGAYLRQPEGASVGDLHLTIFNLGRTIAETLQTLPEASALRRSIEELVRKHKRLWHGQWKIDMLWTVYALQEGVSRKNQGEERIGNQGRGTADLIEFFQVLGEVHDGVKPRMCLISGHTHILFDEDRFPIRRVRIGDGEVRRIAFNHDNSLEQPPSRDVVRRLRRPFPGTLISLRFYLDPKHLRTITGASNE